jgi:hypothetical protein
MEITVLDLEETKKKKGQVPKTKIEKIELVDSEKKISSTEPAKQSSPASKPSGEETAAN